MTVVNQPKVNISVINSATSGPPGETSFVGPGTPTPPPESNIQFIIGMGASNMSGFVSSADYVSPDPILPNLFQFPFSGATPQSAIDLKDPMDFLTSAATTCISPSSQFSRNLANSNSENDYYVIPASRYSSDLTTGLQFDPPLGADYISAKDGIELALSEFPTGQLTTMIWAGTAWLDEPTFTVPAMISNYQNLVAQIKLDSGNSEVDAITYSQPLVFSYGFMVGGQSGQETIDMEEAFRQFPLDNDNCFHVPGPLRDVVNSNFLTPLRSTTLDTGTDYHYSPDALRAIGDVITAIDPIIPSLTTTVPESVFIFDAGNGNVAWIIPSSGAHKFEMRFRATGSSDPFVVVDRWLYWQATAPGEAYLGNVPTESPFSQEVQVRSVSRAGSSDWSNLLIIPGVQRSYAWRINVTANNGDAFVNCFQLSYRSIIGGPDVVLEGQPFQGASFPGFDQANIFDLRTIAGWSSESNGIANATAWIGFYFDEPRVIGEFLWASRGDGSASGPNQAPRDFTLDQALVTDSLIDVNAGLATWTPIISRINETGWSIGEVRTYSSSN